MPLDASDLFTLAARAAAPLLPRYRWRTDDGTVALTFDDGPDPASTPRLLDLLAALEVRATCFLLGAQARRHPDLVRRIADAGHTVGQHTDTHPDPWRIGPKRLAGEMERATRTLEDLLGRPVRWMRPPYGHLTRAGRRWADAHRQHVALWDAVATDFLPGASSASVARALLRWTRPGSIVVLHDGERAARVTPEALARAVPRLRARGLTFAPLPDA